MNTSCYYAVARPKSDNEFDGLSEDGDLEYYSVWSTKYFEWHTWLKQPWVHRSFMFMALLLMADTLIEEPYNTRIHFWGFNLEKVPHWIGHTVFFTCHAAMLALFIISFACMWPTRRKWLIDNAPLPAKKRSVFAELHSVGACIRLRSSVAFCWCAH